MKEPIAEVEEESEHASVTGTPETPANKGATTDTPEEEASIEEKVTKVTGLTKEVIAAE